MIVEWFMGIGAAVIGWFADAVPARPPAEINSVTVSTSDVVAPFLEGANSMGVWLPWGPLAIVFPLVLSVYIVSLFARFLRVILGHIPLVGGNG